MKSNKDEEELLALCRRRNWTSTSVSRLRQLTETTLATVAVPRKVSCEDDVVRATDGMKSMEVRGIKEIPVHSGGQVFRQYSNSFAAGAVPGIRWPFQSSA